ncbi:MAG: bifunctional oligoribonuclease/PAP phosphatase NrnA, partial [Anaerolineae bacterium]|nr:bifunctional oligoribonuclease/PAP phosphatase NrnA [Anaerolineae bacterium]
MTTQEFMQVLEKHRGERHIVVLHAYPDPDAIACAFAHRLISADLGIEVDVVYEGKISHQQNIALVRVLGMDLIEYNQEVDLSRYQGAIFVDNQGGTVPRIVEALQEAEVPVILVVDHHEPQDRLEPEFSDIRQVGATATIYTGYLEEGAIQMDTARKDHVLAATAMMHGILSDTEGFIRAGAQDLQAAAFLARYRDAEALEQVLSQARSKRAMDVIRRALGDRVIAESFSIAGIGFLRAEDRDAIPQAADFLLSEENVHTAIVYGIVRGDDGQERLVGSLRTAKFTLDPDGFIKEVFGKGIEGHWFGGGRDSAGGFSIPIGFLSGDHG